MADTDEPELTRPDNDESCPQGECAPWEEGITSFILTELVLHSAGDLTSLAAVLEAQGLMATHRPLPMDEPMWIFQGICSGEEFDGPETEIAAMLAVVESLDPHTRALWDGCSRRVFDFAYDCGVKPVTVRHDLSAGTMARLAAAGGSLRITLYTFEPRQIKKAEPDAAADGGGM
ncbi:MAG: hypothetical protein DWH91_06930 [Planctomycetota bacterium]|nr:MAG: hypothetical protein DWH91_06930 [Planctomycetota bacterium]